MNDIAERTRALAARFGLAAPVFLAPMAGACPPALSVAVAKAGGMGAGGVLQMDPAEIRSWCGAVRDGTGGRFQLNVWIPGPSPARDAAAEAAVRDFLSRWGPPVAEDAGETKLHDFEAQCEAMLEARPAAISSIMGLYPAHFVARLKAAGIPWLATVTTCGEARAAEAAGADIIVVQGAEAGGHRGAFDAAAAERRQVGLFSLLPAVADAVRVPLVASGGIADARGVAAALILGASGVQIGTGFLRCPEAGLHPAWAAAIAAAAPEDTVVSRVFSGRAGRSIDTAYVRAATAPDAPPPAPYPVQRALTAAMRAMGQRDGDVDRMQAWAGQSARLARAEPAAAVFNRLWDGAAELLGLRPVGVSH